MAVDVFLRDGCGTKNRANIIHDSGEYDGVVSFSHPLYKYQTRIDELFNSDEGVSMNINGSFSGTPVGVHNGTDTTLWTGSNIVGSKATFNSTDVADAGTKSVKIDNPNLNDVWQFDKGSSQDLSSYLAVSMRVYVDRDWDSGDSVEIYGWDGAEVGDRVKLEDYFNEIEFDVWQTIVIPLADMGLTGESITGFRMQQVAKNVKAAKFYLDTIQIEETSAAVKFSYIPPKGKKVVATGIDIILVDNVTEANAKDYSSLLGVNALSSGINFIIKSIGETVYERTITRTFNLVNFPNSSINVSGDGTNTWVKVSYDFSTFPIEMVDTDEISMTVNDDLTGLLEFRATVKSHIKVRRT